MHFLINIFILRNQVRVLNSSVLFAVLSFCSIKVLVVVYINRVRLPHKKKIFGEYHCLMTTKSDRDCALCIIYVVCLPSFIVEFNINLSHFFIVRHSKSITRSVHDIFGRINLLSHELRLSILIILPQII